MLPPTTTLACLGLATTYVALLYALVPDETRARPRNDAEHVKARARATVWSCVVAAGAARAVAGPDAWRVMGLTTTGAGFAVAAPLGAFVVLFAGPIAQAWLGHTSTTVPLSRAYWTSDEATEDDKWVALRNVVVAPLTEEFVFRGAMCAVVLGLGGGASRVDLVWGTPLFFGVAHAHHLASALAEGVPPSRAIATSAFQTLYTTLFGALEMVILLRTGHLVAVVLVHSFCNLMGFPRFDLLARTRVTDWESMLVLGAYVAGAAAFTVGGLFDAATHMPATSLWWSSPTAPLERFPSIPSIPTL